MKRNYQNVKKKTLTNNNNKLTLTLLTALKYLIPTKK